MQSAEGGLFLTFFLQRVKGSSSWSLRVANQWQSPTRPVGINVVKRCQSLGVVGRQYGCESARDFLYITAG
jgi:hypothetical protein